jgi:hypothetical protein
MGFFKKMFEKKECSLCGGEIGLLGNRKLEDGNCCKECAAKLSPWFDDRRHSTVAQIQAQLAYREENKAALNGFRPTVAFGEGYTLRAELENGVPSRFVIERYDGYKDENSDLVSFRDVTSFNIDEDEHREELKYKNSQGEEVSYNPPRYEYSYDFYAEISVNHPYFDDMRFRINRDTLNLETVNQRPVGIRANIGMGAMRRDFDPTLYPEYRKYRKDCDDLEELFRCGMNGMVLPGYEGAAAPAAAPAAEPAPAAPAGPKFCPYCGTKAEGGKFCQSCGAQL